MKIKSDGNSSMSALSLFTSRKVKQALSAIGLILLVGNTVANDCDCTQVVGSCIASVEVRPTGNKKNLFGADLIFRANAPQCAKVEYYHGLTPAITVLKNGRYGEDSLMLGPNPVSSDAITDLVCKVCKTMEQVRKEQAETEQRRDAELEENEQERLHRLAQEEIRGIQGEASRSQAEADRATRERIRSAAISAGIENRPRFNPMENISLEKTITQLQDQLQVQKGQAALQHFGIQQRQQLNVKIQQGVGLKNSPSLEKPKHISKCEQENIERRSRRGGTGIEYKSCR